MRARHNRKATAWEHIRESGSHHLTRDRPWFLATFLPNVGSLTMAAKRIRFVVHPFHNVKIIFLTDVFSTYQYLTYVQPDEQTEPASGGSKRKENAYRKFTFDQQSSRRFGHRNFSLFMFFGKEQQKYKYICWKEAKTLCDSVGAALPVIWNREDLHFLLAFLKLSPFVQFTEAMFVDFIAEKVRFSSFFLNTTVHFHKSVEPQNISPFLTGEVTPQQIIFCTTVCHPNKGICIQRNFLLYLFALSI